MRAQHRGTALLSCRHTRAHGAAADTAKRVHYGLSHAPIARSSGAMAKVRGGVMLSRSERNFMQSVWGGGGLLPLSLG